MRHVGDESSWMRDLHFRNITWNILQIPSEHQNVLLKTPYSVQERNARVLHQTFEKALSVFL